MPLISPLMPVLQVNSMTDRYIQLYVDNRGAAVYKVLNNVII